MFMYCMFNDDGQYMEVSVLENGAPNYSIETYGLGDPWF